ncbi:hypothetical protein M378DRAFT_17568 [Amanita muscaria Koide BX008]|uniref:Uncharacterized protein n=1 Tax=Amanita muscaria (strain Koide BX008) TaxID=946122 RepID=A0A0C2SPC7_AMAMK|nr:hypothetical protein M378DRAFT_17568 [Amanita muscaria Koide BX008]
MSPFAVLDQLFLEILRRVPDQDFLKRYLAILTAHISSSSDYGALHKNDAVLMYVSEEELHANLRRMRSLLKFEPYIDVHHKSFLDFLHDSARSGRYYIGQQGGIRRYLEVFVDSLVRYASAVIEQPNHHNVPHFTPRSRTTIDVFLKRRMSINEWPEVMQPLLDFQDKLLQFSTFPSTWHSLRCNECTIFHVLRELLHLGLHLEAFNPHDDPSFQLESVMNVRNRRGVASSTTNKKKTNGNDLDRLLLSLFVHLPGIMKDRLPTKKVIQLVSAILRFDYAETATRVYFVSDAQKLIDLLCYVSYSSYINGRGL